MFFSLKNLLAIDAIGALLSSVMLLVLMPHLPGYFHMPKSILQSLGFTALFFSVYAACGYFLVRKNHRQWLAVIAIANAVYGFVTGFLVWQFYATISGWDILYFLLELLILVMLVAMEWRAVQSSAT